MFPLRDDNPTEIFPLITLGLIGACVTVWLFVQGAGLDERALTRSVCALGVIPAETLGAGRVGVSGPCALGGATWSALVTSMFLHGSWMHLIGNMWFLWVFGNNIEDSMGHLRFLGFYFVTGSAAAFAQMVVEPTSPVPIVGASGAISAIMGAYMVLYPRARVHTLVFLLVFVTVWTLPAWGFLAYWFLVQLASSAVTAHQAGGGGIAFWAHIGGFVSGLALIGIFRRPELVHAKRAHVRLPRDQIRHGGWW